MRYLIVALVVSLAWLHQDWLIWPLLSEVQKEHDLILGIPAGLGYQVALSFATAAVWFLAVWKAWPTELENWASAGENRRGGGNRSDNRRGGRGQGGRDNRGRTQRGDYRPSADRDRGDRSERSGNDAAMKAAPADAVVAAAVVVVAKAMAATPIPPTTPLKN